MSWRDKVQTMREDKNSKICVNPSLPKPPKPSSVSFGSAPPPHIPEKTAVSRHPASHADVQENLTNPVMPLAANDPAQVSELVAGDAVAPLVTGQTAVRKELVRSEVRTEAAVFSSKVAALVSSTAAVIDDPDRWCWPHSQVMTGREIDTFAERSNQFNRRGLTALDAELLADKLVNRDRDGDDRHLCVECRHCRPGLRCVNKLAVLHVLQRCDHFVPNHLS